MAKKIELLHTTYDESGNVESQEVVHPLTSPDCIIMENGKTLDEVMGDGIATPTLTHEGTSFKVGVGDSNIEVVDGDVAGMTLKGQSYQNILPKPTTLIMETDEQEFKINDKIDSNIIIDDNIAEIATVKGKTIVNTVQEESASEYTVLGEDLSGQSIVTTNKPEGNIKGVTLQGQTLVNTIQEPCEDDYVVLGSEDGIEISAETGGHGTIEDTIGGSIKSAILTGQTLVNLYSADATKSTGNGNFYFINTIPPSMFKSSTYTVINTTNKKLSIAIRSISSSAYVRNVEIDALTKITVTLSDDEWIRFFIASSSDGWVNGDSNDESMLKKMVVIEGDHTQEDIPYFEGMKSVQMPIVKTTGKNLINVKHTLSLTREGNPIATTSDVSKTDFSDITLDSFISTTTSPLYWQYACYRVLNAKPNTTYTLSYSRNVLNSSEDGSVRTHRLIMFSSQHQGTTLPQSDERRAHEITTESDGILFICLADESSNGGGVGTKTQFKDIQLEEGSTATSYEPYQSSTVSINDYTLNSSQFEQGTFSESSPTGKPYKETLPTGYMDIRLRSKSLFKISGNTIRGTLNAGYGIFFGFFKDGKYIAKYSSWMDSTSFSVDVPYECNEFCIVLRKNISDTINVSEYDLIGLKLEQVVELRGIGDVKDELDLQTGKLTQRIEETVLDGSEEWYLAHTKDTTLTFKLISHKIKSDGFKFNDLTEYMMICNNLKNNDNVYSSDTDGEGYIFDGAMILYIGIEKDKLASATNTGFKQWLNSNPIVFQYILPTESIKTIDLQVTDQDGNTIPHIQTQPTVTHINASSDYLIPTVTIDNNLVYDTIIKPSTLYTVRFKHDTVNANNPLTVDLGGTTQTVTSTEFTITTPDTLTHNQLVFSGKNNVVSEVQVIESDMTNIEYPFFEGMNDVKEVSMKVTGKNLMYIPSDLQIIGGHQSTITLSYSNGIITLTGKTTVEDNTERYVSINAYAYLEGGKTYTISFESDAEASATNGTDTVEIFLAWENKYVKDENGLMEFHEIKAKTKTIKPNLTGKYYLRLDLNKASGTTHSFYNIQVEEGSIVTPYEPYHEIIVQQDVDSIPLTSDMFEQGYYDYNHNCIKSMSLQQMIKQNSDIRLRSKILIPVKPNSRYILNNDTMYLWCLAFDKDGSYLGYRIGTIGDTTLSEFTTDSFTHFVVPVIFKVAGGDEDILPSDLDSMNLILQEVPQEIVLRGIGDVKDELDLARGEYIQRIGEIVLDGSEEWAKNGTHTNGSYRYMCNTYTNAKLSSDKVLCDKMSFARVNGTTGEGMTSDMHIIYTTSTGKAQIATTKTLGELKTWLAQNPIKVQYVLATPIIHKVNLTNTKVIPSYATETHYETITPSDSLIPNITIPSTLNYDVAIKPSTEYTIRANTSDNLTVDLGGTTGTLSNGKVTLTTPATLTHNEVKFSGTGKVKELMVVEGNEIKDNVPFFNGMKDVQMGGIKLVNIARGATCNSLVTANTNKTQFTYTSNGSSSWGNIMFDKTLLKPNTTYTLYMNIKTNTSDNRIKVQLGNGNEGYLNILAGTTGLIKQTITTAKDLPVNMSINCVNSSVSGQQVVIQNPMIIEGDWTHLDEIPFIESEMIIDQPIIRSQGKNLFDGVLACATIGDNTGELVISESLPHKSTLNYIQVNSKQKLFVSFTSENGYAGYCKMYCYDKNKKFLNKTINISANYTDDVHKLVNVSEDGSVGYIRLRFFSGDGTTVAQPKNIIISNSEAPYEPYKHQTLYSNRVIGYEENCYYSGSDGKKYAHAYVNTVIADVEGLSIAYITNVSTNITFWDKDDVYILGKSHIDTALSNPDINGFVIVPSNAKYVKFASGNVSEEYATYYTKATVTGDLPLRSLPNGVCDTLNLVTGEYVQRVGEVVLDGSHPCTNDKTNGTLLRFNMFSINSTEKNMIKVQSSLKCDKLPVLIDVINNQECIHNGGSDNYKLMLWIDGSHLSTQDASGLNKYLSQNPITVQYELATPIVRKLGFTTKGNYTEQTVANVDTMVMDSYEDKHYRMKGNGLQDSISDSPIFTNNYNVRYYPTEIHGDYSYISQIGNTTYINLLKNGDFNDTVGRQWLSQNPIKVGYISTNQSSESYSNIHKPIFFNNVDVLFLPNNLGIQPELTYQVRTRNSYVLDMMKANTKYSIKLLDSSGNMTIDGTSYTLANNRTFVSPSTLTNKELIILGQWYEPMIIEGDVTGKNLPYFKGILSSYHDVDEIEVYSVSKNLFDKSFALGNVDVNGNPVQSTINILSGIIEVKGNTTYSVSGITKHITDSKAYFIQYDQSMKLIKTGVTFPFITDSNCKYLRLQINQTTDIENINNSLQLEEGIVATSYAPHAHSTTLIEMPTRLETVKVVRPTIIEGRINLTDGTLQDNYNSQIMVRSDSYIPVQPNDYIHFDNDGQDRYANVVCYDINKNYICYLNNGSLHTEYVPNNCYFICFYMGKSNYSNLTLTIKRNKPIQLNSLPNGVCDEIIMKPNNNKAQLVQRVGKVVLDGSENFRVGDDNRVNVYRYYINNDIGMKNGSALDGLCDKLPIIKDIYLDAEGVRLGSTNFNLYIYANKILKPDIQVLKEYLKENPIIVYYELATPIIHEIQLKGYPHVYEDGTVTLNTDTPHQTLVSYNVNQEQLINTQNETIIRHDQQIDDLYYYIEMYLEEIYQMELFRMKLELSL